MCWNAPVRPPNSSHFVRLRNEVKVNTERVGIRNQGGIAPPASSRYTGASKGT